METTRGSHTSVHITDTCDGLAIENPLLLRKPLNKEIKVLLLSSHEKTVDLYPAPFLFLLFKAKKRISVVTSDNTQNKVQKKIKLRPRESSNTREKICNKFLKITISEKQEAG